MIKKSLFDRKPDNILIDKHGHVKLADFGLCTNYIAKSPKSINKGNDSSSEEEEATEVKSQSSPPYQHRRLNSLVGNPDYVSPEVIQSPDDGYGAASDYWALGCILFECLLGYPPFYSDDPDPMTTLKKITDWKNHLYIPPDIPISSEARDLISKLICDVSDRLKLEEIKQHPFFKGINWYCLKLDPPVIPRMTSDVDTQYFEEYNDIIISSLPETKLYTNKMSPQDIAFASFDFTRPEKLSIRSNSTVLDIFCKISFLFLPLQIRMN